MQMEGPSTSLPHGKKEEAGLISTIQQYHSDASHLELGWTQQAKGTVPNKTALVSDASCKSGGPQANSASD